MNCDRCNSSRLELIEENGEAVCLNCDKIFPLRLERVGSNWEWKLIE